MADHTTEQIDRAERQLLDRLRQVYGGKRWIVAGGIAQGIDGGVLTVRSLGAEDAIAIAARTGVGPLSDDVRFIISNDAHVAEDAGMIERMHDNNRELHDLPAWVIAEVDEWDPDRSAQVIVAFTIDGGLIANRPTFGARTPESTMLEDKIAIRELWHKAGIATAPDRVVDADDIDALLNAHRDLATRWGTVWAVDNDQGWHGGGTGTHWITSAEQAQALVTKMAGHHRQVRVQPFLEGVPCSIHGMVLRDATLAFRPCEMIVLLDTENQKFEYARAATFWDPSEHDRVGMQSVARAIGDALRDQVDYRGVFTVDGVLTADGFRPTEVNPRFGAALPSRIPTADGETLPLFNTHLAAATGNLDDLDPARLEALLVRRLDENRQGGCMIFTDIAPPDEQLHVAIAGTWNGDEFVDMHMIATEEADDGPAVIAQVSWGENPGGGLVMITFTAVMPVGPPVAPTVVQIRELLDDHWGLGLATLRPAFG